MSYHAGCFRSASVFLLLALAGCSTNPPPEKAPPKKQLQNVTIHLEGRVKEVRLAEVVEDIKQLEIHYSKDGEKQEYFRAIGLWNEATENLKGGGKLSVKDEAGEREIPFKIVPKQTRFYLGHGDMVFLDKVIVVGLARKQKLLLVRVQDSRLRGEEAQPYEKYLSDDQFAVLDRGGTVVLYVPSKELEGPCRVVHEAAPAKVEERSLLFLVK